MRTPLLTRHDRNWQFYWYGGNHSEWNHTKRMSNWYAWHHPQNVPTIGGEIGNPRRRYLYPCHGPLRNRYVYWWFYSHRFWPNLARIYPGFDFDCFGNRYSGPRNRSDPSEDVWKSFVFRRQSNRYGSTDHTLWSSPLYRDRIGPQNPVKRHYDEFSRH